MQFVFDIDGTISFDGKTIHEEIQQAIYQLLEEGHEVIFASARPIRDLLPILPEAFHTCRLIGGNGALTKQDGKIQAIYFEQVIQEKLCEIIERYQLTYLADSDWDFAYTGDETHSIYGRIQHEVAKNIRLHELPRICKIVLFDVQKQALDELVTLSVTISQYASENIVDISPLSIHKARSLQGDFIAFGNDMNDRTLFEEASYSICVGNGEVAQFASRIITEQEVAQTIRTMNKFIRKLN